MLTADQIALYDLKSPFEGFGVLLNQKRGLIKAVWDFDDQGGAVGTLNLLDDQGTLITIPDNTIIVQGWIDPYTAMTSTSNDGEISFALNTAEDLLADVDADSIGTTITALIPAGAAANMVKATAARNIVMEVKVNALLSGAFSLFLEYCYGE